MATFTYKKTVAEKLEDRDPITRADIESIDMFGAPFIDRLMMADEATRQYKVAEALYRDGMMIIKAE